MEIVLVETLLVYTYSKNPELIYELHILKSQLESYTGL